jgi:hypothetical protein
VLSLVALRYVDEATLSEGMRWMVRLAFPVAAILMALAFFLSVLSPSATEPNAMIYLAYVARVVLAVGLLAQHGGEAEFRGALSVRSPHDEVRAAYAPSEIPQVYAASSYWVIEGVGLCSPISLEGRLCPIPIAPSCVECNHSTGEWEVCPTRRSRTT